MKVFVAPRGYGKTTELVEWVKEGSPDGRQRVIVAPFPHNPVYHVTPGVKVISVSQYNNNFVDCRKIEFGIDDIDAMIQQLSRGSVGMVTMTGELWLPNPGSAARDLQRTIRRLN